MTHPAGTWMIAYGAFLIVMGVVGYLSNPAKAATAVLSGGTFGALSVFWGVLLRRGMERALWGAIATTGLLTAVFAWRATAGWLAVAAGHDEKLFAAALITTMEAATVVVLVALLRARR